MHGLGSYRGHICMLRKPLEMCHTGTHNHTHLNRVTSAVINNPLTVYNRHLLQAKLTTITAIILNTHLSYTFTNLYQYINVTKQQDVSLASCVVVINGSWVWTQTSLSLLPECFLLKTAITPLPLYKHINLHCKQHHSQITNVCVML